MICGLDRKFAFYFINALLDNEFVVFYNYKKSLGKLLYIM